ncbi:MAG: hypothetical protein ACE5J9_08920 [Methanosarcinales archaeon]
MKKILKGLNCFSNLITLFFIVILAILPVQAWSNGGYSNDPYNPAYGTHDWIAQKAIDFLPQKEKQYILDNLASYLYGTELPDNPKGIGDYWNHHVYFYFNGSIMDDGSAIRSEEEYRNTLSFLRSGDYVNWNC